MQIKNTGIMYQIINNIKIIAFYFHIVECCPHCESVKHRTIPSFVPYCPFEVITHGSDGAWFVSAEAIGAAVVSYPGP